MTFETWIICRVATKRSRLLVLVDSEILVDKAVSHGSTLSQKKKKRIQRFRTPCDWHELLSSSELPCDCVRGVAKSLQQLRSLPREAVGRAMAAPTVRRNERRQNRARRWLRLFCRALSQCAFHSFFDYFNVLFSERISLVAFV